MLRDIIKANKDAAKGEIGKYMGKHGEKVDRELGELAGAVYGKRAAKEITGRAKEAPEEGRELP